MAKRLTKEEKLQIYLKSNRDEIAKKLRKNKYEKLEKQYNFEEKIKTIIPCTECLVRPSCVDRFKTDIISSLIDCEILRTFNKAMYYVRLLGTSYIESPDYEKRIVRYVEKKVSEGKIKL